MWGSVFVNVISLKYIGMIYINVSEMCFIPMHPPSLFLSLSLHLSLFLWYPHPVFLISGLSLRFGDVEVFFLQSKVLCSYTHLI